MIRAPLRFYLISLLFICALNFCASNPWLTMNIPARLTKEEELYFQSPPVDERLADAECDSAWERYYNNKKCNQHRLGR